MRRNREAGQALYLTAAGLVVLLGFMGLGIDIGALRYQRRLQQTAADAAAIAGANNLAYQGSSGVVCAGQNAATVNGFTDTSGGGGCANGSISTCTASDAAIGTVCVQVNNPPSFWASDPHLGDSHYVEVVVAAVHPTYFMRVLNVSSKTVMARAEATDLSGGTTVSNCLYTLGNPDNKIGVDSYGHTTINAPTCGIADNGNFDPIGNALTINTCSFSVSGANTGNNAGNVYCDGQSQPPTYGNPTTQDPFANKLTPPPVGTPQTFNASNPVPGTYNGIDIGKNTTVNFQPGIYVVTGQDFLCEGGSTINGDGVMFYFTNGATVNCQGNVNTNLTAPNSTNCPSCDSQYYGILMYQDPCDSNTGLQPGGSVPCNPNQGLGNCPPPGSGPNTGPELGGNDGSMYKGVLYFPADQLYLTGNTGTTAGIVTVAASISYSVCTGGNSTFNVIGNSGLPNPLPNLSNAILVE